MTGLCASCGRSESECIELGGRCCMDCEHGRSGLTPAERAGVAFVEAHRDAIIQVANAIERSPVTRDQIAWMVAAVMVRIHGDAHALEATYAELAAAQRHGFI